MYNITREGRMNFIKISENFDLNIDIKIILFWAIKII